MVLRAPAGYLETGTLELMEPEQLTQILPTLLSLKRQLSMRSGIRFLPMRLMAVQAQFR